MSIQEKRVGSRQEPKKMGKKIIKENYRVKICEEKYPNLQLIQIKKLKKLSQKYF